MSQLILNPVIHHADGRGPDRSVESRFPWDRALYSSSGPASRPGGSMRASS